MRQLPVYFCIVLFSMMNFIILQSTFNFVVTQRPLFDQLYHAVLQFGSISFCKMAETQEQVVFVET